MTSDTPPGWFPDPEHAEQLRYWDGSAWTEQRAPTPAAGLTGDSSARAARSSSPNRNSPKRLLAVVVAALIVGAVIVGILNKSDSGDTTDNNVPPTARQMGEIIGSTLTEDDPVMQICKDTADEHYDPESQDWTS